MHRVRSMVYENPVQREQSLLSPKIRGLQNPLRDVAYFLDVVTNSQDEVRAVEDPRHVSSLKVSNSVSHLISLSILQPNQISRTPFIVASGELLLGKLD